MTTNRLKQELFGQSKSFVDRRLKAIQKTIDEIKLALNSETKSSAGDKHETGRAMLQIEREKAGQQLSEIQKLNQTLSRINISKESKSVGLGSVVLTNHSNYFISISAGKVEVNNEMFYAISANTPIGKLILGKQKGDQIQFRNQMIEIMEVL